jgi:hypothetical protein
LGLARRHSRRGGGTQGPLLCILIMAPNVKRLNLLASSLADLDIVQAKYLPLTHPSEQAQQSVQASIRTPAPTASYWDWPADTPEEVEEPKDLFSASSLEANLVKDSQREASADIIYATDAAENDDYWSERVVEETITKPQHDSYWSWPAQPQEAHIQAILEDEATRQQLSADKIVKNLVNSRFADRASQQNPACDSYWAWQSPAQVVSDSLDEVYSQAYWEWKSDDRSKAEINKSEMIKTILASEACRQIVSLAKIEQNLKKSSLPATCATQASSDDYWSWAPAVEEGYWDWSAKSVTTGMGYWDM